MDSRVVGQWIGTKYQYAKNTIQFKQNNFNKNKLDNFFRKLHFFE